MDFPKSVPGVGLVGGVFVDENQATGQPGSLMAAAWGNAVTEELLSIIRAAGLVPSEAKTNQVLEAIRALVPERSAFARRAGTNSLPADAFGIFALADGGAAATVTLPSTVDLVSDTELLLFANHSNIAAVQIKAAAGQTVQGPAALMGASTTAFMLPVGGDWVRLRSEKAQSRWVVVACYPAGVQSRVTALENAPKGLGFNQSIATFTAAQRPVNTWFENLTASPKFVSALRSPGGNSNWRIDVRIAGVEKPVTVFGAVGETAVIHTLQAIVPPGAAYKLTFYAGSSDYTVQELTS